MSRKGENIYHRKDGRWEGRYIKLRSPHQKTVYGYVYANSYTAVKEKLLKARLTVQDNKCNKESPKFSEMAERWLLHKKATVKASTCAIYQNKLSNYILPYFGEYMISSITTIMLQNFTVQLSTEHLVSKKLSAKTIADILTVTKSILRSAEEIGYILNCNLSILKYKCSTKEIRVLSIEEQRIVNNKLLCSINYTTLGILLSLYTGIRIGELCSLTINDIDLSCSKLKVWRTLQRIHYDDNNTKSTILIFTTPKSKKSTREIPLPDFILKEIKKLSYEDGNFLLSGTNTPVEPRTMQNRYNHFMKDLGINNTTFHTLRHTFATRCIEAKFDTKTLSELLGHSSVNLTLNRYVHSSYDLKVENMKKLSMFV